MTAVITKCIKDIHISVGCIDLLHKDFNENPNSIKMQISKTLSVLYIQEWHSKIASSSKGLNYNLILKLMPILKII